MTIEIPREAEKFIKQQLATGHFANEAEVVAQALSLWQNYQQKSVEVRAGVQRGIDSMEAGRYTKISNPEEAKALADDIKKRGRELRAKRESSTH